MPLTKKWVQPTSIPEGRHTATIFHLEVRPVEKGKEKWEYLDIFFRIEDVENNPEIKYSVPNSPNISEASKLGKLLMTLGEKFVKDVEIDIEKVLLNKKVSILTLKDGNTPYSKIVDDSIKSA
jgi:hypothetical protein